MFNRNMHQQTTTFVPHFRFLFGTPFHHPVQASVSLWKTHSSCTRGSALLVVTHPVTLCANCRHRSHRSLCLALLCKCSSRYAGHSMGRSHCLLCVTRSVFVVWTSGAVFSVVDLWTHDVCSGLRCPCFTRPRFELGLSLRVQQVSAKRDRQT